MPPARPTRSDLEEVATGCVCQALRRAARAITRSYDEALVGTGVTTTQFSILVAVELHGAPTISRLADTLSLDRTTLTRDLVPLERRALIEIRPGEDRRARLVELTPQGRSAVSHAYPRWRAVQEDATGGDRDRWRDTSADLARLAAAAG